MAPRDEDRSMGRREFFRRLWPLSTEDSVDSTAENSVSRPPRPVLPLGPVPPCLKLSERLENPCVDCDAPCLKSCEFGIIDRHPEDHALAGRAYLQFEHSGCTWCGDCLEVCPQTPPAEERVTRIGVALLDQGLCMPFKNIVCIACQDVCPREAILFDERGRPTIHPLQCDGCGICVAPCPTDALTVVPENPRG